MTDGTLVLADAAMKEKHTKCNLIVEGTSSANRLCSFNPARYGKRIHLSRRGDWQLAKVPYGLWWRQWHRNNTAGALIKATSYFHHHASEDICIAALPRGTLTQQARASSASAQWNWMWVRDCAWGNKLTHTHRERNTHYFLSPSSRAKNTEGLWWGCR